MIRNYLDNTTLTLPLSLREWAAAANAAAGEGHFMR